MIKINNNGFSMVQIMMAAGMMGALSLGVMKMMENQRKSAHSIKTSAAAHDFYLEAKAYLARPGYCTKNFEGVKISEGDELELTDVLKSNGKVLYKSGGIYSRLLKLESITTSNFEKDSKTTALMQLKFKLNKVGNSYGAKGYTKIIKLSLHLDENGAIKNCSIFGISTGSKFEGSEAAVKVEQGIKDLNSGKDSDDSKKVKGLLDKSPALREINNSIKTMQDTNKRMEEMFGD